MLFTIGTSNRSADQFFETLKKYGVSRIIDVRSKPWSRLPQWRLQEAQQEAIARGFKFTWQGKVLGGLNDIPTNVPLYQKIIENVVALADQHNVAVYCSEGDPSECHRSWKVGSYFLARHGVVVQNILRDGSTEDITKTLLRTHPDNIPDCLRVEALTLSYHAEGKTLPGWLQPPQAQEA
jgi:uncharacterized protein (DUF488 family)